MSKQNEEMVDVTVYLDKDLADSFKKATKKELIERGAGLALCNKVQDETIADLEKQLSTEKKLKERFRSRMHQNEFSLRQARDMLEAIMNGWEEYQE